MKIKNQIVVEVDDIEPTVFWEDTARNGNGDNVKGYKVTVKVDWGQVFPGRPVEYASASASGATPDTAYGAAIRRVLTPTH